MKYRHFLSSAIALLAMGCNNKASVPATMDTATVSEAEQLPAFFTDSFPLADDSSGGTVLVDEKKQLELSIRLLKDKKIRKPLDFTTLKPENVLGIYKNLKLEITKYTDSNQQYMVYFNDFFEQMRLREELMLDTAKIDVRTRLEIARVKSEINTGFALQKSPASEESK